MVNDSEQRPEDEVTTTQEHPEETATTVSDEDEEEWEYQPPIEPNEVRKAVAGIATSFWDAVIQPTREMVREGFDMANDFARDLGGKPRRKK